MPCLAIVASEAATKNLLSHMCAEEGGEGEVGFGV